MKSTESAILSLFCGGLWGIIAYIIIKPITSSPIGFWFLWGIGCILIWIIIVKIDK